jgi:hypothetical protein
MHVLLVIIGAHAVILGFGFALAGWMALIAPDEHELADLKTRGEIARQKSWLQAQLFALQWQRQFSSVYRIAAHWGDRPQARKLIYVGVAFLAVAAAVAYCLGL